MKTQERRRGCIAEFVSRVGATASGGGGFSAGSSVWTGCDGHARIVEMEGNVVVTQHLIYTLHQQLGISLKSNNPKLVR